MNTEIVVSQDGSHTLFIPELNEHYHSTFGAITESQHVFIKYGYHAIEKDFISVLEIGFGTGLNALLTMIESERMNRFTQFTTIEKYPLKENLTKALNYSKILGYPDSILEILHAAAWEQMVNITPYFSLMKIKGDIRDITLNSNFDCVYFDAFGPDVQPELWTPAVFGKIYDSMNSDSLLTTYSAKGQVRRNLKAIGFEVKKQPGPKGKREITVASKSLI